MTESVRILMLEDNLDDAAIIQKWLNRKGFNFVATIVDSKEDFEKAINTQAFDVVLSDHSLPQFNSAEALKIAHQKNPFMPFIIITGAVPEDNAISLFEKGADNYVMKDNLNRLPSAILKAIENKKYEREAAANRNKKS